MFSTLGVCGLGRALHRQIPIELALGGIIASAVLQLRTHCSEVPRRGSASSLVDAFSELQFAASVRLCSSHETLPATCSFAPATRASDN